MDVSSIARIFSLSAILYFAYQVNQSARLQSKSELSSVQEEARIQKLQYGFLTAVSSVLFLFVSLNPDILTRVFVFYFVLGMVGMYALLSYYSLSRQLSRTATASEGYEIKKKRMVYGIVFLGCIVVGFTSNRDDNSPEALIAQLVKCRDILDA